MGRSAKEFRRSLVPVTGLPTADDTALLRAAVPPESPQPIAQTVKTKTQQLRNGYSKGRTR